MHISFIYMCDQFYKLEYNYLPKRFGKQLKLVSIYKQKIGYWPTHIRNVSAQIWLKPP